MMPALCLAQQPMIKQGVAQNIVPRASHIARRTQTNMYPEFSNFYNRDFKAYSTLS
jgi:hypothetical protein